MIPASLGAGLDKEARRLRCAPTMFLHCRGEWVAKVVSEPVDRAALLHALTQRDAVLDNGGMHICSSRVVAFYARASHTRLDVPRLKNHGFMSEGDRVPWTGQSHRP
jgi:hypothetical protein